MRKFPEILKTEILKGLPGSEWQWQMASSDRMVKNFSRSPGMDARVAAVLILLYPSKGSVYTVLMQRPDYNGVHGGQISFPGGKNEPSDEDIIKTAIREAQEETGVDPGSVTIIGILTPLFIPVSNMFVTPVVGWTNKKPSFSPQAGEVVFLFEADLKKLLDPLIINTRPLEIRGEKIDIKYFNYEGNMIWGATAMILNELLIIIKRSNIL
jgi:8-oxo-dGTP pyrophosphatase MutT (NUDIX family)